MAFIMLIAIMIYFFISVQVTWRSEFNQKAMLVCLYAFYMMQDGFNLKNNNNPKIIKY